MTIQLYCGNDKHDFWLTLHAKECWKLNEVLKKELHWLRRFGATIKAITVEDN